MNFPHLRTAFLIIALISPEAPDVAEADDPIILGDCTFTWNANTEFDLAGYRLYLGRISSLLNQVNDVGQRTSIRCSEVGATANGPWVAAITAYDTKGNSSARSSSLRFELTGLPEPAHPQQVAEPYFVRLVLRDPGFQLWWIDTNRPKVDYRIEVASSLQPNWTTAKVQRAGITRFSYFQSHGAEWVCYRVRAESGVIVSQWAMASGPDDRQFCFKPAPIPAIEQPLLAPSIFPEPLSVQLTPAQYGFELTWEQPGIIPPSYRIEVNSSVDPRWTTLAVLPPGATRFTIAGPIDAERVCVRIRAEQQPFISLWAMAEGPQDRQFCFTPEL